MIQAIETNYNGYRFRSRLEARWAVFFDACKIPYVYEEQGFTLPSGNYLPDFWLPEQEYYIEIKGVEPTEHECDLANQLADITGKRVHIFFGDIPQPDALDYDMYELGSSYAFFPGNITFYDRHNMWNWREKGMPPQEYEEPRIEVPLYKLKPTTLSELVNIDHQIAKLQQQTGARARIKIKQLRKNMSTDAWIDLTTAIDLDNRPEWEYYASGGGFDQPYVWGQCFECGKFSIGYSGWDERLACKGSCGICMAIARHGYWEASTKDAYRKCPYHETSCDGCYNKGKGDSWAAPRLITAYRAARSARFEHGETPKVPRGKPRK